MMTASGVSKLLVIMVLGLALAGCSSLRIGTEGIKAFYCGTETKPGAYVPVRWSQRDTDETIAQTKANNSVHSEICR
jgi:uncharacterized protein YceK